MTNKKGISDAIIPIGLGLSIMILLFLLCQMMTNEWQQKKSACINLGYKDLNSYMHVGLCEDNDKNLHYVSFDCKKNWLEITTNCTAKNIKVGDVSVASQ